MIMHPELQHLLLVAQAGVDERQGTGVDRFPLAALC
jgi:hypothetical protein